jgi:hypothetical protein
MVEDQRVNSCFFNVGQSRSDIINWSDGKNDDDEEDGDGCDIILGFLNLF